MNEHTDTQEQRNTICQSVNTCKINIKMNDEQTLFLSSLSQGSKALNTWRYEPSSQPDNVVLSMATMALTTYKRWSTLLISGSYSCMCAGHL